MPIYDFACNQCEHRFDKLVRRSDESVECGKCHSEDVRKLFSTFSSPGSSSQAEEFCPPGGCGRCADPGFCSMN